MESIVYFKKGTQAQYDALEVKNQNTLYFITDEETGIHRIYKGNALYGFGAPTYDGAGHITPDFLGASFHTAGTFVATDLQVDPIVVQRTQNSGGGYTVAIGGVING